MQNLLNINIFYQNITNCQNVLKEDNSIFDEFTSLKIVNLTDSPNGEVRLDSYWRQPLRFLIAPIEEIIISDIIFIIDEFNNRVDGLWIRQNQRFWSHQDVKIFQILNTTKMFTFLCHQNLKSFEALKTSRCCCILSVIKN